jgi:hypothetical protein
MLVNAGRVGAESFVLVRTRPVAAYQAAGVTVWALLVATVAFAVRPSLALWPWMSLAGLDAVVTITSGLVVFVAADWVWKRLVESLVADAASAIQYAPCTGTDHVQDRHVG